MKRALYDILAALPPCVRCKEPVKSLRHVHLVAWMCDGSDHFEGDDSCHRYVCPKHGRGGDLDHGDVTVSFCGRCVIDKLLEGGS